MLEKFSAGAIQAINAAREEALRLEFSQVDTDHLLLGLAHERQGVLARALERKQLGLRQLRLAVEHLSGRGYSLTRMEDLVFSPAALRALATAAQANPILVEAADLFFALMEEPEGAVARAIRELQLEPTQLLDLAHELNSDEAQAPSGTIVPSRFSHRLLTSKGDAVLSYAYAATRFFGHTIVGTEQLLTGLLHAKDSLAAQVLAVNGVEVIAVEAITARVIGRGSGTLAGRPTLSRWTEEVLDRAWAHARRFKHERVGTGHVLLGLTELDVGGALYILDHLDVNLAQIRYDVEQSFAQAPGDPEPREAYPDPDADDASLLEEA